MDSFSKKQYVHPLAFCPFALREHEWDEVRSIQFGKSPTSSSTFSSHIRPLDWCNNKDGIYGNLLCGVCFLPIGADTSMYSCRGCFDDDHRTGSYHKECIEPISKHPYHPKHSLILQFFWFGDLLCQCCSKPQNFFYMCCICDFRMCQSCSRKPPLLKIDHPKRHDHTLFYFPKIGSLICDFCALSDHYSSMYLCLQCDIVAHKECVYLPCIIRMSRHEHRLSFTYSLTPEKLLCGVCRGKIHTNYGRYFCIKGCSFGVHSRCATREDVWDGKELEGIPEDTYEEEIKLYNVISDGIIQHFSHQNHHLQLDEETNRTFDANKHCRGCALPICNEIIYSCMQCDDFILHQTCAHLPRKKLHVMHPHPLSLQVELEVVWISCSACHRKTNGFVYLCDKLECYFMLDLCCASIAEPLDHRCHPHPLFLTSNPQTQEICSVCKINQDYRLNCGECGFVSCFGCATLPNKMRYKYDEHFLIFSYDEDASSQCLCDICEKEVDPKKNGVYICNDCNVTLHIECLLGNYPERYIMPGRKLRSDVSILPNNSLTRDICNLCHNRCHGKVVYEMSDKTILCSEKCVNG